MALWCVAATALFAASPGSAFAADVIELKLAHYLPTVNGLHSEFMEPWARELEACTKGKVKVTIYPGGTQLGNPTKLYDSVRAGVVDIAHGLTGVPAGRFERTRIADLPFLFTSSDSLTRTLWELYPNYLAQEYPGVKMLALHGPNPAQIHTATKSVKTPDDLKGLRLRSTTTAVKLMFEALGATPVGLPAGQVYENIQKGVIDGTGFTWDTMVAFNLAEVTKHHLDAKLYEVSMWFAMNEKTYNALPADVRNCVDKLSGDNLIPKFGPWWNKWDKAGYDRVVAEGHEIVTLDDKQRAEWAKRLEPMVNDYLSGLEKKGVTNAREIYAQMKEKAAKYNK
jgi:TRAP-type C4-dicarboxylate transport system substrate-binding protein